MVPKNVDRYLQTCESGTREYQVAYAIAYACATGRFSAEIESTISAMDDNEIASIVEEAIGAGVSTIAEANRWLRDYFFSKGDNS